MCGKSRLGTSSLVCARRDRVDARHPVVPVPDDLIHVGYDKPDSRIAEPVAFELRSLIILMGRFRLTDSCEVTTLSLSADLVEMITELDNPIVRALRFHITRAPRMRNDLQIKFLTLH